MVTGEYFFFFQSITRLRIKPTPFAFGLFDVYLYEYACVCWQHTCCCATPALNQHIWSLITSEIPPLIHLLNSQWPPRQAAPNYPAPVRHRHIIIWLVSHLWRLPAVICLPAAVPAPSYRSRETWEIESTQVCHQCGSIQSARRLNLSSEPIRVIKVKVSRCSDAGRVHFQNSPLSIL